MSEPIQQTISAEELCQLTGLTDARHRQLAAAGYFPKPDKALYQLTATIQGMFRFYREVNEKRGAFAESRTVKLEKEINLIEANTSRVRRKDQLERGEVIPAPLVYKTWENIIILARAKLLQIPNKVESQCAVGITPALVRGIIDREVDEALKEFGRDIVYSPKAEVEEEEKEQMEAA